MKTMGFKSVVLLALLSLVLTAWPVWTNAEVVDFSGDPSSVTYGFTSRTTLSGVPDYIGITVVAPLRGACSWGTGLATATPNSSPTSKTP